MSHNLIILSDIKKVPKEYKKKREFYISYFPMQFVLRITLFDLENAFEN